MIGMSSPGKSYLLEQFPKFQLDQFDELRVVHHVHLVQKHHDVGNAHLPGQENVLPGLGHGAIVGGHTTRMAPSIWAAPVIMFLI